MGKNRGEERCEVDSASLLAQFGQRVEARSIPRFVVFDDCLAVAISAAERRSVELISVLQKFIHKCFERFWLFNCGEFVIGGLFHRAAQDISVDFSRQARRLHSQCRALSPLLYRPAIAV
jgi:hypothetical protein